MQTLLIFLFLQLFLTSSIISQISGISGAKLFVPDASTVQEGKFEFEPSFIVSTARNEFTSNGEVKPLNGKLITSGLAFRVTIGLGDNLEAGTSLSSVLDQISIGAKYRVIEKEMTSVAIIGGVDLPAGNRFLPDSVIDSDDHKYFSLGTLFSNKFSESFNLDLFLSYTYLSGEHPFNSINNMGIAFGYFPTVKLQLILELNGGISYSKNIETAGLAVSPGVTYRMTSSMILVAGLSFDFFGKNLPKNDSYFAAFTITM